MQAYLSYWYARLCTPLDHIPPKQTFWDRSVIASDRVQAQCCPDSSLFSWPPFWLLSPATAETAVVVCITDCILLTQLARRGDSQSCRPIHRRGSPVDARRLHIGQPVSHDFANSSHDSS